MDNITLVENNELANDKIIVSERERARALNEPPKRSVLEN